MFFSVVVAIYNVEKYIRECIDSIIHQSYKNFELILVDDGSPDNCGDICDEYAKRDSRIRVIHKKNGGVVSARNVGLSAAAGEYVFNVDGDDYIDEALFQKIADIAEEYDPGIIVFDPIQLVDGKKIFEKKYLKKGLYTGKELSAVKEKLIYNSMSPSNSGIIAHTITFKAVKKEILRKYQMRVPENIKCGEDFAVAIPLIFDADKVYFSNIDGYYYRRHEASLTHVLDRYAIEDICNLTVFMEDVLDYEKYQTGSQMTVYITNRLFYALVSACRNLNSYSEYKKFTEKTDGFLINKIDGYRYTVHNLKLSVISFSLKHRLFWLFWLYYHRRK